MWGFYIDIYIKEDIIKKLQQKKYETVKKNDILTGDQLSTKQYNALKSDYGKGLKKSDILVFIDGTIFKNGKKGIIFTQNYLYSSYLGTGFNKNIKIANPIPYSEIKSVKDNGNDIAITMKNNDSFDLYFSLYNDVVVNAIRIIIKMLSNQYTDTVTKKEVKPKTTSTKSKATLTKQKTTSKKESEPKTAAVAETKKPVETIEKAKEPEIDLKLRKKRLLEQKFNLEKLVEIIVRASEMTCKIKTPGSENFIPARWVFGKNKQEVIKKAYKAFAKEYANEYYLILTNEKRGDEGIQFTNQGCYYTNGHFDYLNVINIQDDGKYSLLTYADGKQEKVDFGKFKPFFNQYYYYFYKFIDDEVNEVIIQKELESAEKKN